MGRGKEAGLQLGSLHIFLGSWVGWVSRGQEAGLSLGSLHVFFSELALGSLHIAFLGSWVGWVVRGQEARLPLGSLHVSFFLGSWVGWVGRGKKLGSRWAPFILFSAPGRMGRARPRAGLPSCFLSGVLGRMGGPRLRG